MSRRRSFVLAWSLLLAHASTAPDLRAQSRVDVPEGCGSEDELRSELVRLLGADRARDAMPERLSITPAEDGRFALALQLRGESRTLRDADCKALFKTAAIVAAAAIDPSLASQAGGSAEPTPSPTTEAGSAAESGSGSGSGSGSDSEPEPEPGPPPPLHADIALGTGASLALLPSAAPMLALSATLTLGRFGVGLGGRYLFHAEEQLESGRGVEVYGFGGRLTLVYDPLSFLRVQAGAALDSLVGRGTGLGIAGERNAGPALALLLELAAIPIRVGQLYVSIGVSGQYAVVRPSFRITGYGEVYRVQRWGGTGIVSVGWQFL